MVEFCYLLLGLPVDLAWVADSTDTAYAAVRVGRHAAGVGGTSLPLPWGVSPHPSVGRRYTLLLEMAQLTFSFMV